MKAQGDERSVMVEIKDEVYGSDFCQWSLPGDSHHSHGQYISKSSSICPEYLVRTEIHVYVTMMPMFNRKSHERTLNKKFTL